MSFNAIEFSAKNKLEFSAKNKSGLTTLHTTEDLELAKMIITTNPEAIFAQDKSGRTVLSTQKNLAIIDYIFSVTPEERQITLFESDKSGSSALFHTRCDECLFFLVEKAKGIGIDLVNRTNNKGQNVLFRRLSPTATSFLIDEGIDTKCVDIKGRTALFFANAHLTKWLLEEDGEAVNTVDSFGNTALFYACTPAVAKILIRYGADVGVVNKYGESLIHNFRERADMLEVVV